MKKVLSVLLALSLVFLCACSVQDKSGGQLDAKIDGLIENMQVKWDTDDKATVSFDEHTVNNVVVELKKVTASPLKIYLNDSDDSLIYEQANNSTYKYCAFKGVNTSSLVISLEGGKDNVKSISVYENQNEPDDDFRVTAYILGDKIQNIDSLKSYTFDTITDVILFSCVNFDSNGNLEYNDNEQLSGKKILKTALSNLRTVIGDRKVNIYINILGPNADDGISDWKSQMENKAQKHTKAFENASLASDISNLLNDYDLDGVFFDYENPIKAKYWKAFSNFIVDLDSELGSKKIGLAMSDWDIGLYKEAVDCVDLVEMMEYDLFDDYGDNSSFDSARKGIEKFLKAGFDSKVLDLGIPFYGRPVDKSENWYNYGDWSKELGKYNNKAIVDGKESYFNSYQLVYDKTSLAIDYNLGGVMSFRYLCDDLENEDLSLFTAMHQAINDRKN